MDLNTREIIRAINNVAKGGGGGENNNNSSLEINCFTINDKPYGFVIGEFESGVLMLDLNKVYTIDQFLSLNVLELEGIFNSPVDNHLTGFFIYKSIEDLNSRNYCLVEYQRLDSPDFAGFSFGSLLPDGISTKYRQVQLNDEEYYILCMYGDATIETYNSGQGR